MRVTTRTSMHQVAPPSKNSDQASKNFDTEEATENFGVVPLFETAG